MNMSMLVIDRGVQADTKITYNTKADSSMVSFFGPLKLYFCR